MSDTHERPEPQYETEATRDEVVVRRSPRYGVWMLAGAVVGVIVAFVLSFAFAPTEAQIAERVQEDFTYDQGQVFGFLLLGGVAVGVALGALVALVVDRAMSRRVTHAVAEHDETHRVDG
ncbi:potassium transporter Trk [Agromyces sp. H3Y2-19a]|uniref:potassium transporter Trk n=1 Tax=Agromyces chromiiresistens TaxID=3030835 RepID=UPI0023B8F635|nr:potassium transporter Trk [Agromyces chromiiresistens]MDF0512195.1 potassium transporter Trk [Agromyces chromiiresistens]